MDDSVNDPVVCRSDSQYPERPVALYYDGERLAIDQVLARWRTPEGRRFRVLARGHLAFELFYHEAEDRWEIEPA